nr:unnamed protein product [Spirometra erinaceieuropaei]
MADARLLEEPEKFVTRPDILIMGDFNAPYIDWSSTHANSSEQNFDRSFLNTALKLFLTQHVMLPTRVHDGQQANCLDLVLTKSQDSIDEVSCLPPLAVHVSDQQSAEDAVNSGVPQGSVLGPQLFLVYVNDCANKLNCYVAMFADDIKIWSTIRSEVDEARLQTNLDHLEQWSKDWLLPFNVNKCTFLRVGRTSSPNHTVYRLTGKPLQEVDAQKDLGVWITTSL